jgi:hypothetical protein
MEQELSKLAKWKLHRFYSTNPARVLPRKIHFTLPKRVCLPNTANTTNESYNSNVYKVKKSQQHHTRRVMVCWLLELIFVLMIAAAIMLFMRGFMR